MASSGSKPHPPYLPKPPKNPLSETLTPKPNLSTSTTIPPSQALSRVSYMTREELLRRRASNLKQLRKLYKAQYWAFMVEVQHLHGEYYWKYGVSPFKDEHNTDGGAADVAEATEENINNINSNYNGGNGGGGAAAVLRCAANGCKTKAMALTNFCHLHILSDKRQRLYKPCVYVIKSAHAGPLTCGKPILRSTVPSFCTLHIQMSQKNVKKALKKAGLNMSSSNKLAPKFHVLIAEYVRQIQAKRRAAGRANGKKVAVKEETSD